MQITKRGKVDYYFDVHPRHNFMTYYTQEYMEETRKLLELLDLNLKDKVLLDIGIGRGRSLPLFKTLGIRKVVGVDVREEEMAYTREQIKRVKLPVEIILDDANNTRLKKLRSNSFDCVTLMNILLCLPNDKIRRILINEAKRIVKPDGYIVILDMQRPSLLAFFSYLSRKPWKFRNDREIIDLMVPMKLKGKRSSNHFYFINKIADVLGVTFGPKIFTSLNLVFRFLRVPPSTKTFVFQK